MSQHKKSKGAWKYFHTIDGRPAFYVPGEQICFHSEGSFHRMKKYRFFVDSYKVILKERRASQYWRHQRGFDLTKDTSYGYVRVWIQ